MKLRRTLVVLASFFMLSSHAIAQKAHPYLFYTNDRIKELKDKLKADTAMSNAWQNMLTKCNAAVASGKGGDMEALALAYRMTGDKKYALQAKTLLQNLAGKEYWEKLTDRDPVWNAALVTAHNNLVSGSVFDAIYDALTTTERTAIANGIYKLGIAPSLGDWLWADTRMHTLNSMGHNWWAAMMFDAGTASLAIMTEKPEAKKWAQQAMDASKEWFSFSGSVLENKPKSFDPNGGFYESINYANFPIGDYLFFRIAWTDVYGKTVMPYDGLLQKTMDWFMQMSYPQSGTLQSVNFGDGGLSANGERPVKLMMALGFTNKNYLWYLRETGKGRQREDLNITQPLGLLFSPVVPGKVPLPSLPTSSMYDGMGWASLRSSWQENATMFAIKSGTTWNHAHADAGSFILFHNGKNLLIDGGNAWYASPLYTKYYVRSEAHNVVLFNGKAQDAQDAYNGVKNPGHLYNLLDAGDFKYILADATGPTSHYFLRNYRNVVWVGNVILIIDDVKSYDSGKFEWLLHTSVDAKKNGIDFEVKDSNAAVLVRPLFPETLPIGLPHDFPEKMQWEEKTGYKDHEPDVKKTYYSFFPSEESRQTKFITAIILKDENNKPGNTGSSANATPATLPVIEKLEGENYIGVKITQDGVTTDVYFNLLADGRLMHRNSISHIAGWETDAYLMAMSYKSGADSSNAENIKRWFVANGSYIRKSDTVVFNTLSKAFMVADFKGSEANVLLQGQPVVDLGLRLNKGVGKLSVNGKMVAIKNGDDGLKRIEINEGENK